MLYLERELLVHDAEELRRRLFEDFRVRYLLFHDIRHILLDLELDLLDEIFPELFVSFASEDIIPLLVDRLPLLVDDAIIIE